MATGVPGHHQAWRVSRELLTRWPQSSGQPHHLSCQLLRVQWCYSRRHLPNQHRFSGSVKQPPSHCGTEGPSY